MAGAAGEHRLERILGVTSVLARELPAASDPAAGRTIEAVLEQIGRLCQADRAYVALRVPGTDRFSVVHRWATEVGHASLARAEAVDAEEYPYIASQLVRRLVFRFPADLPVESIRDREALARRGITSLVAAPIVVAGQLAGLVGFDCLRDEPAFDATTAGALGVVAQLLAHAEERRGNEHFAAESRSMTDGLIETARYGIYRAAIDGTILLANAALVRTLGYQSAADLLGRNIGSTCYVDATERQSLLDRCLAIGRITGHRVRWRRRDGSTVMVELSTRVIRTPEGIPLMLEGFVDEPTLADGPPVAAPRLEVLGRFVTYLAHDLNNLLGVIIANAHLMAMSHPEQDPPDEMTSLLHAADRGRTLVESLVRFSRHEPSGGAAIDVNGSLRKSVALARPILKRDLAISTRVIGILPPIRADETAIDLILLNLLKNASDATPDGGSVVVEARSRGDHVALLVSDSGAGMSPEVRQRVFEANFSTKPPGLGSGLGLSIVKHLTDRLGGSVAIDSEPGQGTTVIVVLPGAGGPRHG